VAAFSQYTAQTLYTNLSLHVRNSVPGLFYTGDYNKAAQEFNLI